MDDDDVEIKPQRAATSGALPDNANSEDGFISARAKVIVTHEYGPLIEGLIPRLRAEPDTDVYEATSGFAILNAKKLRPCVLVAQATDNADVIRILSLMKSLQNEIKKLKEVKVIIISKFKHDAIVQKFQMYGATEILTEPIQPKSLEFKVKTHVKGLKATRTRLRAMEKNYVEEQKKKALAKIKDQDSNSYGSKAAIEKVDPASSKLVIKSKGAAGEKAKKLAEDVWVFKAAPKKDDPSSAGKKIGPDPDKGEWKESGKGLGSKKRWKFKESEESSAEGETQGGSKKGWEYDGEKPEFEDDHWNFDAEEGKLSYTDRGGRKRIFNQEELGGAKLTEEKVLEEVEKEYQENLVPDPIKFEEPSDAGDSHGETEEQELFEEDDGISDWASKQEEKEARDRARGEQEQAASSEARKEMSAAEFLREKKKRDREAAEAQMAEDERAMREIEIAAQKSLDEMNAAREKAAKNKTPKGAADFVEKAADAGGSSPFFQESSLFEEEGLSYTDSAEKGYESGELSYAEEAAPANDRPDYREEKTESGFSGGEIREERPEGSSLKGMFKKNRTASREIDFEDIAQKKEEGIDYTDTEENDESPELSIALEKKIETPFERGAESSKEEKLAFSPLNLIVEWTDLILMGRELGHERILELFAIRVRKSAVARFVAFADVSGRLMASSGLNASGLGGFSAKNAQGMCDAIQRKEAIMMRDPQDVKSATIYVPLFSIDKEPVGVFCMSVSSNNELLGKLKQVGCIGAIMRGFMSMVAASQKKAA